MTQLPLTEEDSELLARAVVYTRVGRFTDAERLKLVLLVARLSPKWDNTQGAWNLLPAAVKRRHRGRSE